MMIIVGYEEAVRSVTVNKKKILKEVDSAGILFIIPNRQSIAALEDCS